MGKPRLSHIAKGKTLIGLNSQPDSIRKRQKIVRTFSLPSICLCKSIKPCQYFKTRACLSVQRGEFIGKLKKKNSSTKLKLKHKYCNPSQGKKCRRRSTILINNDHNKDKSLKTQEKRPSVCANLNDDKNASGSRDKTKLREVPTIRPNSNSRISSLIGLADDLVLGASQSVSKSVSQLVSQSVSHSDSDVVPLQVYTPETGLIDEITTETDDIFPPEHWGDGGMNTEPGFMDRFLEDVLRFSESTSSESGDSLTSRHTDNCQPLRKQGTIELISDHDTEYSEDSSSSHPMQKLRNNTWANSLDRQDDTVTFSDTGEFFCNEVKRQTDSDVINTSENSKLDISRHFLTSPKQTCQQTTHHGLSEDSYDVIHNTYRNLWQPTPGYRCPICDAILDILPFPHTSHVSLPPSGDTSLRHTGHVSYERSDFDLFCPQCCCMRWVSSM